MVTYVDKHIDTQTKTQDIISARRASFIGDGYGSINSHKELHETPLLVICAVSASVCMYVCVPFRRFKMFSSFHCSTFENIGQLVQYNEIIDCCEQRKYCGTQLEEKRVAMSCFDELIAFSFSLEHGLPEVIKT
jgi:hypothetical protein